MQNPVAAYEEGVAHIINNWTALTLAVEHGWGGRDSQKKRSFFISHVLTEVCPFTGKASCGNDRDTLADLMADYLSEKFNMDLDDDSDLEVANWILKLKESLTKGDATVVQRIGTHTPSNLEMCRTTAGPDDDGCSDDNDDMDDGDDGDGGD
eukprot:GHVO01046713.1.p2 GENE.GHVO01046713.1~~GHVO01046713.1.p2  ORF type:complete len:152 (-),score=28.01 GHVO01046713.1:1122-1577(-)